MNSRKISINNFIFPKNKNILNEQVLFKDKLQKAKNININQHNELKEKIYFFKEKEIQENSITEEDDYYLEIYNNPIEEGAHFLLELENNDKYKTIPTYSHLKELNQNLLKFNNNKDIKCKSYSQNFYTNSIEIIDNLNLTIEENEKSSNESIHFFMNSINIFKKMHKGRKKLKILNNKISKDKNNKIHKVEIKNDKYISVNKFSKKYQSNNSKNTDKGIITKHMKIGSQPFNGPYLRKNKINSIKNLDKYLSNNNISLYGLNDDENKNKCKIKPETKSLFSRYSQIDTNIYDQKLNITNVNSKFNNFKNKRIKIITNPLYDINKNEHTDKSNGDLRLREQNNYIFNLKFYNIFNNKEPKNKKLKVKSNSVINEYSSYDEIYNKNMESNKIIEVKTPKKNIIKKRVVFEEEYMIDSNGNQKFLCVKRVQDNDDRSGQNTLNNQDENINKRAFTSNNLLKSSKNRNFKKKIEYNFSNNRKLINENLNEKKNNKKKLEAKTIFFSPQISYENIFSTNNNLTNSYANISNIKNSKKKVCINNINNIKVDKNNFPNSKSCIFKYDHNIKFHKIDNYSNKNKFKNPLNKLLNIKEDNEKNKNGKNNEQSMINRNQIRKKYGIEKALAINNSRNYKENNFINEYNNKEKYINNDTNNDKINVKKYIYKTTNFENDQIFISKQKFSNKSERNNYKYHEIKSISKEKSNNNYEIYSKKSQNNNFYYETKNKNHKIFPCTSMDNIKMIKSNSFKSDNIYKFPIKDRLEKHNIQSINISKPNNPLCFSQQIQKL